MIFQGLSVARICPAPVSILDIKRGLCVMNEFWKFVLKIIVIYKHFDKNFIKININKTSKKTKKHIQQPVI